MAINPNTITFFVEKIRNAEYTAFRSIVIQLFAYLSNEIKDNPIYDKYEREGKNWANWPDSDSEKLSRKDWKFPEDIESAKTLAYQIYKNITLKNKDWITNLIFSLFKSSKLSDNLDRLNSTFLGYFNLALEEIVSANPEIDINKAKRLEYKTAFIVHGHDNELKVEVQLLLRKAGVNNIVLHEQPDKGRSIIDKLIDETKIAGYAIALLTPDDLTTDGNNRARQNVILEVGYFLGLLGKERIRMIVKGEIEIPSDLHGILYEKFDVSGAWKIKLLKELQAVGIYVDFESVISIF